ncbi:MAG TPA: hypothetical protein VGK48_04495 [Terriglobia bacterium]|jgi:hypothetical protein
MRSPLTALAWEIWRKNRGWAWLIIGMILFGRIWMAVVPNVYVNGGVPTLLFLISHLFVFGLLNYTETNPQRQAAGFPERLYTLPVSSAVLVAVPTVFAVVSILLVRFAWTSFNGFEVNGFNTMKLITFVVLYQGILWVLDSFGVMRIVVLGIVAIWLIAFGFPLVPEANAQALENVRIAELLLVMTAALLVSWGHVARRRSRAANAGELREREVFARRFSDRRQRRSTPFDSPAAAQFWFEWRRSGRVLPFYVGLLLLLVFGPIAIYAGREAESTLRILAAALAMPILLALPIGKGFSKPDFWSKDMTLTSFLAVRPLTTHDLVMIKAKVAACSALISWLLVFVFLSIWIPAGANIESLKQLRVRIYAIAGSEYSGSVILVLSVAAGLFLTWRFLVDGLWLGLWGNRMFYASSAIPYAVLPVVGLIGLAVIGQNKQSLFAWIFQKREDVLTAGLWIAVAALIVKFGLSVVAWRGVPAKQLRQYLIVWICGTCCLIALAILIWNGLRPLLPPDVNRLRLLLILVAVSTMPLGRLGLASMTLARNRHR